jgi:tight adherence protein C
MTETLIPAALTGIAVAGVSLLVVRPTRRLGPRVAPYAQRARLLLGETTDPSLLVAPPAGARARSSVFGPIIDTGAKRLSALLDAGGETALTRKLRHAGYRDMTPEQYRMRQLASTARGALLGVAFALLVAPTGLTVVLLLAFGSAWGALRWRSRIDRAITRRREQMRAELYTIAQLIAIQVRASTAPLVAVESLVRRGGGAVTQELGDALAWIRDKTSPRDAFERLANDTAEPAAARLYRLLATGDIGSSHTFGEALRHAANDLRSQQREDLERLAVRRRFQMLAPTVVVMGPVMFLYLAAPIPRLIFGP